MRKILLAFLNTLEIAVLFCLVGTFCTIFVDHTQQWPKSKATSKIVNAEALDVVLSSSLSVTYLPAIFSETYENVVDKGISLSNPEEVKDQTFLSEEERYTYQGVRYDQQFPISITFITDTPGEYEVPMIFNPLIPTSGLPDNIFDAGSGYTMVYADPIGNISIIPHSGFLITPVGDGNYIETRYEADILREYVEGGNSSDTTFGYLEEEVRSRLSAMKYANMNQNDVSIQLKITSAAIIDATRLNDITNTIEPREIASLIGVTLEKPSIVIVTCGWRWDTPFVYLDDSYALKERIIIILQPQD